MRRSSDSCARHASPRVMHSKLLAPAWRWTIKAAIKAGLLPDIGHFELHLRDRLCDAAHGTPLAHMRLLQGWQRVDHSRPPTVPLGIVEGLFDCSLIDEESRRTGSAQDPHSSLTASDWFLGQMGDAVPSSLSSRADLHAILQHPDVICNVGTAGDTGAVHAATGILATPSVIAALPHKLNARQNLNATLHQGNHMQLQSQLSVAAVSWQSSSASTFGFDTTTDLGESAALPTAMASGDTGGNGEVRLEVDEGGDGIFGGQEGPVVVVAGGSSRSEKECARHKMRRLDPESAPRIIESAGIGPTRPSTAAPSTTTRGSCRVNSSLLEGRELGT